MRTSKLSTIYIVLLFVLCSWNTSVSHSNYVAVVGINQNLQEQYEVGEVFFQYGAKSDMALEIENNYTSDIKYYHCGMYIGKGEIVEATSEQGVVISTDKDWQTGRRFHIYKMQSLSKHSKEIRKLALELVGKPYNDTFLPEDKGFYCSQLVQYITNTVLKKEVIKSEPMQFGNGPTEASAFWVDYYKKRGMSVPLGKPGTHPTLIAKNFTRLVVSD